MYFGAKLGGREGGKCFGVEKTKIPPLTVVVWTELDRVGDLKRNKSLVGKMKQINV